MKDYGPTTPHDDAKIASYGLAQPIAPYRMFGKRLFDIVLVVLMLPALILILAPLVLIIRRDGGPGIYSQERVGRNGKRFACLKLRTMVVNAEQVLEDLCASDPRIAHEWHNKQKLTNDPRVTPIGKFLRATSLDELPQFFNVLMGDMSFVGPRPFMTSQELLYKSAGGQAYFEMRPGITGPWQVLGRGETGFLDRIQFDQQYLQNRSMAYDLSLIFKTVFVVLRRTGN